MIFQVAIKMRDAFGRPTTKRYELDTTDFPTAQSEVAAMVTDLAALTGMEVVSSTTGVATVVSDTVTAGANIDAGITLSLQKADGKVAPLKVPAPDLSVVNSDGSVDITDVLVTNFTDNWISGNFLISGGETAVALLSGKLDK